MNMNFQHYFDNDKYTLKSWLKHIIFHSSQTQFATNVKYVYNINEII